MFEDSLIESTDRIKTSRGKATVVSFTVQAVIVAFLVLIPMIFVEALPAHQLMTTLVAPPPPPPPPPPPRAGRTSEARPQPVVKEQLNPNELRTPSRIPKEIVKTQEIASAAPPSNAPPAMGGVVGGVPGGVAGGTVGGVLGGVLNSPNMPKVELKRVRVSQGVSQGLLTHKVQPEYPPLAKQAHVQGTVLLHAVIGKDGKVENLQVVSGHPMLSKAAIDAVKQWQYKPYMLNGKPVEIDTTITVNFQLAG